MSLKVRSIVSITLARTGSHDYQVTYWQDGVARFDGHSGLRQGAWEATVDPAWFAWAAKLGRSIEPGRVDASDEPVSLVIETADGRSVYEAADLHEPPEFWLLSTLLEGMTHRTRWSPLDVTGNDDFANWAGGTPIWMSLGGATASALGRSGSIVVLAGGYASAATSPSLDVRYQQMRTRLIDEGALALEGDHLRVARHLLFASPSAAASVLLGSNTSGRRSWRNSVGRAWSELDLD